MKNKISAVLLAGSLFLTVSVCAGDFTAKPVKDIGHCKITFAYNSESGMLEMSVEDRQGNAVQLHEEKITVKIRRKSRNAQMTAALKSDPMDGENKGSSHYRDFHKFLSDFDTFTVFLKITINGKPCYSEWEFTKNGN